MTTQPRERAETDPGSIGTGSETQIEEDDDRED